ncbi:MAG: prepilin-type N-terminal cleavage/methylation domain-containing protein [Puniceicoccales bacterium]|nr:prepilin-type N-terminal cleavage/methylation domain-containing protein [Puniceicoccales bacterium]
MNRSHSKGFTLLELLLAMAIGTALTMVAAMYLRGIEDRSTATADRTEFALKRARLVQQLEDDLLNLSPETFTILATGATWQTSSPKKFCTYAFEADKKRLHRFFTDGDGAASAVEMTARTVLLDGVEEFSIGTLDTGSAPSYVISIRFSGETAKTRILLAP